MFLSVSLNKLKGWLDGENAFSLGISNMSWFILFSLLLKAWLHGPGLPNKYNKRIMGINYLSLNQ